MIQTTKQKRNYHFRWTDYNSYSAKKIDISIHFHLLQSYDSELETINTHKLGRKFTYPNVLFVLFALLSSEAYRGGAKAYRGGAEAHRGGGQEEDRCGTEEPKKTLKKVIEHCLIY